MALLTVLFWCLLIGIPLYLFFKLRSSKSEKEPEVPLLPPEEKWWGKGEPSYEETVINPFEIHVSDEQLVDLKNRLENALPLHEPLEGVKQNYGMNTNLLNTIIDYWLTKYDWRNREKFLNQYPHYKVNIQGLDIHFIHIVPKKVDNVKVLPLLLVHGWPGSVREFYDIIPILTTPQKGRNFVFELVIPSIPGYGFSEGTSKPGLGSSHIAIIFKNLMAKLGHKKYYIQGGDWGSHIIGEMKSLYPDRILGMHINSPMAISGKSFLKLIAASYFPNWFVNEEHAEIIFPLMKTFSYMILETGYIHLHATKPDTVGVALRDSPAGLAAYILEKFTTWTDRSWRDLEDGGLTKKFTMDALLDNIMIYWWTKSITTSIRLYAEALTGSGKLQCIRPDSSMVPLGCARCRNDFMFLPDWVTRNSYPNVVHLSDLKVGHFAAMEMPDVFAEDIFAFVEKVENL